MCFRVLGVQALVVDICVEYHINSRIIVMHITFYHKDPTLPSWTDLIGQPLLPVWQARPIPVLLAAGCVAIIARLTKKRRRRREGS